MKCSMPLEAHHSAPSCTALVAAEPSLHVLARTAAATRGELVSGRPCKWKRQSKECELRHSRQVPPNQVPAQLLLRPCQPCLASGPAFLPAFTLAEQSAHLAAHAGKALQVFGCRGMPWLAHQKAAVSKGEEGGSQRWQLLEGRGPERACRSWRCYKQQVSGCCNAGLSVGDGQRDGSREPAATAGMVQVRYLGIVSCECKHPPPAATPACLG